MSEAMAMQGLQPAMARPCRLARQRSEQHNVRLRGLGERVRHWRRLRGLTAADLASFLGLSAAQMSKYEQGFDELVASRIYLLAGLLNL